MGMLIVAVAGGLRLLEIETLAAVVSILSLTNSALSLWGQSQHVHWRLLCWLAAGQLPALALGLYFLDQLGANARWLLELCLGVFLTLGALGMLLKPKPLQRVSPSWVAWLTGLCGGPLGGGRGGGLQLRRRGGRITGDRPPSYARGAQSENSAHALDARQLEGVGEPGHPSMAGDIRGRLRASHASKRRQGQGRHDRSPGGGRGIAHRRFVFQGLRRCSTGRAPGLSSDLRAAPLTGFPTSECATTRQTFARCGCQTTKRCVG